MIGLLSLNALKLGLKRLLFANGFASIGWTMNGASFTRGKKRDFILMPKILQGKRSGKCATPIGFTIKKAFHIFIVKVKLLQKKIREIGLMC